MNSDVGSKKAVYKVSNVHFIFLILLGLISLFLLGWNFEYLYPPGKIRGQYLVIFSLVLCIMFLYAVWKWRESLLSVRIHSGKLELKYFFSRRLRVFNLEELTKVQCAIDGVKTDSIKHAIDILNYQVFKEKTKGAVELLLKFKNDELHVPPTTFTKYQMKIILTGISHHWP